MAIRSVYNRPDPEKGTSIGPDGKARNPLGQPPQFRATGKGLNVSYPELQANAVQGNAFLAAKFADHETFPSRPWLRKIHLFITGFQTGWSVSGETAQTQKSRSWYPRNLSQDDFIVQGQMPNQFEYDKLVEFVEYHQRHMVTNTNKFQTHEKGFNPVQVEAVEFFMGLKKDKEYSEHDRAAHRAHFKYRQTPYMHKTVAIMNIKAGHERFQFAPAFTITLKILNDHLQDDYDTEYEIREMVYGDDIDNPDAVPVLVWTDGNNTLISGEHSLNDPIASRGGWTPGGGRGIIPQ